MSFTPEKAREKLVNLDQTQQSIQSTSQWCLFHYRHHREIVQLWLSSLEALERGDPKRSLLYFYLCNDLVQFAKKNEHKFRGFLQEFVKVLPKALKVMRECVVKECDGDLDKQRQLISKYLRVLNVWEQRNIFDKRFIAKLSAILSPEGEVSATKVHKAKLAEQRDRKLQAIVNHAESGSTKVPEELSSLVSKYTSLQAVQEKNLADFTHINTVYNELQKNLPEPRKLIERLSGLEKMTEALQSQMDKASELRGGISDELKRLIGVQADWIQLDQGKVDQLKHMVADADKQKQEMQQLVDKTMDVAEDVSPIYEEVSPAYEEDDDELPTYQAGPDDDEPAMPLDKPEEPAVDEAEQFVQDFATEPETSPVQNSEALLSLLKNLS